MMNTLTLPPVSHPTLLRAQAYLAARPNLVRALKWLAVLSVSLVVMLLLTHVNAQTLNSLTDNTATKACTEAKSLTNSKWLKVLFSLNNNRTVYGSWQIKWQLRNNGNENGLRR